jgi:adenylyltransferase/sulfurtransferase
MNQSSSSSLEQENQQLRAYIEKLERELQQSKSEQHKQPPIATTDNNNNTETTSSNKRLLTNEQIARYSRHLLLPEIGVVRQARLCNSKALIVGAGGLGAPCAMYLAAAGVGTLGLVDFDVVDTSNLHRQVIHTESREGMSKVLSAAITCRNLNSGITVNTYNEPFSVQNALDLVSQYDVVIDASDNVSTRYLVNDACVLAGKPLVSGSAVRFEGQLTVYNFKSKETGCPCYRCLFPVPPPPETVTNCADGGVMGVVPGVIGCLQALEAQKILMQMDDPADGILSKRMLLFQAKTNTFRNVKLRSRKLDCVICGDNPTITSLVAYDDPACADKKPGPVNDLETHNRITVQEYNNLTKQQQEQLDHLLIDVRESVQFDIASLDNAINIPVKKLPQEFERIRDLIVGKQGHDQNIEKYPIYVVCRRGRLSVTGTKIFLEQGFTNVKNVEGGVTEWRRHVDPSFPSY